MENKLNVCLLNDSFYPKLDGVVNVVDSYARIITSEYGNAFIATPKYPGVTDDYPYEIMRYPSLNSQHFFGYRAGNPFTPEIVTQIADRNPDIIHCHCPFSSGYLARLIRQRSNAPMIFTYHTKFDYDIKRVLKSKSLCNIAVNIVISNIASSDEVWTVSHGAGENLRSLGYEGEYIVMPNGVDFSKGRASEEAVRSIDLLHSIPEGIPVFLFVGRLQWYKGIRIILDALKRYAVQGNDFRMIFIGSGMEEKEIKSYAKKLSVSDRCIFTGAIRDRETIKAYYSRCNLFLFPSQFDTNGIVVREAAACGLASVLISGSCAAEDTADKRNVLLFDGTAESLAGLLCEVGSNFEYMKTLGEHAMEELYFSWADSVKNAVERYHIVLEEKERKEHNGTIHANDGKFIVETDKLLRNMSRMSKLAKKIYKSPKQ